MQKKKVNFCKKMKEKNLGYFAKKMPKIKF